MVKRLFQVYLNEKKNSWLYSCYYCRAHLAFHEDLISKSFQGSQGRAYLFNNVVNVRFSDVKQRVLLTGIHFVADAYCSGCDAALGWKYERALEPSQRYKEGKIIIELAHLIKDNYWDRDWSKIPFEKTLADTFECVFGRAIRGLRGQSDFADSCSSQETGCSTSSLSESWRPSNTAFEPLSEINFDNHTVALCVPSSSLYASTTRSIESALMQHPVLRCRTNSRSSLVLTSQSTLLDSDDAHDTLPLLNGLNCSTPGSSKQSPIMHLINASKNGWRRRRRGRRRPKSPSPSLDSLIPAAAIDDDQPVVDGENVDPEVEADHIEQAGS